MGTIDWNFATSRVQARLLASEDRELYVRLYVDPKVMAHIATPMDSAAAETAFARTCRANANPAARSRCWRLTHRQTREALGLAAFMRSAREPLRAEVGIMLLPEWHARGVALSALRGLIDALLGDDWTLGIEELIGRHAPSNRGAEGLMRMVGFRRMPVAGGTTEWRLDRAQWQRMHSDGAGSGDITAGDSPGRSL